MAVRQDEVQIRVNFITDESKRLAKTILETKELNAGIERNKKSLVEYDKQLKNTNLSEQQREVILKKIALAEADIVDKQQQIVRSGQAIENLDLSKLTPSQLVARAKQLAIAMRDIPASSPEYAVLNAELLKVNTRTAELRNNAKALGSDGGGFGRIFSTITKISAAIAVASVAIRSFFAGLSGAGKLEQLNIAFETFLGSATKAKQVVADLRKFADVTPFETEPVINAGRALLAFGFNSKDLIPTLTKVGDVAAGTGKDFNELALIYGKARAEGKIQNDTLNQLAEAGIPIYEELAKILKVNENQIRKLAEGGKINFKDLERAFTNLTSEGGSFAGLMERQSQSLNGLFSTLASAIQNKITQAFNNVVPAIKSLTQGFIDFLSVPVSQKLEQEREAFNGLALQITNAGVGTKERTAFIKQLQDQYPEYLKNIDAERVTNQQLQPILDTINKSYVVRIALQQQQEKITPFLKEEAVAANDLAEKRTQFNQLLARGAELSGVNLSAQKDEAAQLQAVIDGLRKKVGAQGFRLFGTDDAVVLGKLLSTQVQITNAAGRQKNASNDLTNAEKQRLAVVEELKKSYGTLVDDILGGSGSVGGEGGGSGAATADKLKALLDLRFKDIEKDAANRNLILANARFKDQIDEERYQAGLIGVEKRALQDRLQAYKDFGKEKEIEAINTQIKLIEIEQKQKELQDQSSIPDPLNALPSQSPGAVANQQQSDLTEKLRLAELKQRFQTAFNIEQDYELARLVAKRALIDEELEILRNATGDQTAEIKKREDEKAKIEEDINQKRLKNAQDAEDLKRKIEQASFQATSDIFGLTIELLSQNENQRKKNAGVIKAAQRAQIILDGITEVQRIWLQAQSLGPIAGPIIGGIQTGIAITRSALALSKLDAVKVAARGIMIPKFGIFGGKPHSQGGTRGYFEDGTMVEVEKDEAWAVMNKRSTGMIKAWSDMNVAGGGLPYMATGGLMKFAQGGGLSNVNTTPNSSAVAVASSAAAGGFDLQRFEAIISRFEVSVTKMPTRVKADVVLTEFETRQSELDTIRTDASI